MNKKKSVFPVKIPSAKRDDQPATRGLLKIVKLELKEDMKMLESRLNRKIDSVINRSDRQFNILGAKTSKDKQQYLKKFNKLESSLEQLKNMYHSLCLKMEEMHSENRLVLESIQALWQRQDIIEKDRRG